MGPDFHDDQKTIKKNPTKVTNKNKKKFKPYFGTQKITKNRGHKYIVTKKFSTKVAKKIKKNSKKGFLKTA